MNAAIHLELGVNATQVFNLSQRQGPIRVATTGQAPTLTATWNTRARTLTAWILAILDAAVGMVDLWRRAIPFGLRRQAKAG